MEIVRLVELAECSLNQNWACDSKCDCENENCECVPEM